MNRFLKSPWATPEVVPLVVPILGGIVGAGYMGYKHLAKNPDVFINHNNEYLKNPDLYLSDEPTKYKKFVNHSKAVRDLNNRI